LSIQLTRFGNTKVTQLNSVFELPPVYRGQPLSPVEIDAILLGGANMFDKPKTDATEKKKKK